MRLFISILLLSALWAGGCAAGPPYHPPKIKSPPSYAELNSSVNTNEPVARWWNEFHDPELDHLIEEALRNNFDLQIATMRIRESRYQRNIAAADLFPEADATGSYIRSRGSRNVVLPLGGSSGTGSSGSSSAPKGSGPTPKDSSASSPNETDVTPNPLSTQPSPFGQGGLPGATTDLYQVGFDASWEIDVFGGKRRQVQAAAAEVEASAESRHNMQVSLAAETAQNFLQLRGAQERLQIARDNLTAQTLVLTLTRSKRSVGLTSEFDVIRAAAQVSETASSIPPLEANCRRLIHSLSILIGKDPDELSAELDQSKPLPATPPEVPIGLPSQLLKRRPDIKQAEREIAAANARIGSAQSDLFPKFALVGNAGLDSSSPGNLFNWESRYFLISPTVTWRIFDAGRILSNIRLQRANKQEAALQYRNTILKALQEVEDALVNYASEKIRREQLADEARQDQRTLDLARQRYDHGLTDFLSVLDAERNLYSAQDALAISTLSVTTDLVALYKSLGGGWK
jgi:multidrug efflux system outer membrane protein